MIKEIPGLQRVIVLQDLLKLLVQFFLYNFLRHSSKLQVHEFKRIDKLKRFNGVKQVVRS
jgi:hypothetical protein